MHKKIGWMLMAASFSVFANTNDVLSAARLKGEVAQKKIENTRLKAFEKTTQTHTKPYRGFVEKMRLTHDLSKTHEDSIYDAMLLVSFSMPNALLFSLADEASTYGIPLIIKGLKEDDFKKTIDTFYKLNKCASKENLKFEGVSIDPFYFQELHIEKVPALVLIKRPSQCLPHTPCSSRQSDVVYGNSKIKDALLTIRAKGELKDFAQLILDKHHV